MDPRDRRILGALEEGLPLVREPYAELGGRLGIAEEEILWRLNGMREAGIIRRFRARLNQRRAGITANALVAWNCNGMDPVRAGALLASFPCVTHCYEREPVQDRWDYTLYTVHHGYSRHEVEEEVVRISEQAGLPDYCILFSTEEFKRVPNVRITGNGGGQP